jgi:hypothetical protein
MSSRRPPPLSLPRSRKILVYTPQKCFETIINKTPLFHISIFFTEFSALFLVLGDTEYSVVDTCDTTTSGIRIDYEWCRSILAPFSRRFV